MNVAGGTLNNSKEYTQFEYIDVDNLQGSNEEGRWNGKAAVISTCDANHRFWVVTFARTWGFAALNACSL